MYSSTSPCPLPIKSLTSILKAAKVSVHLLLRDSLDPLVNISVPHLKVGEWKVEDVVKQGEDKIEFEKVLGYHQHNHAGLGSIKQTEVPAKLTHDYRKLVSDKVPDMQEERYFAKADTLPFSNESEELGYYDRGRLLTVFCQGLHHCSCSLWLILFYLYLFIVDKNIQI